MISVTKYGHSYHPTYPVSEANGVGLRRIIAVLSMQYSGLYELVYLGGIFHRTMENGVYTSTVHPLAQKRSVGKATGYLGR